MYWHCPLINKPLSDNLFAILSKASSILVELKKYSLHFQASWLVGIKIARAHDASGIDNISVYIGQTIPEAGTVKGLILWALCSWIVSISFQRTAAYFFLTSCGALFCLNDPFLLILNSIVLFFPFLYRVRTSLSWLLLPLRSLSEWSTRTHMTTFLKVFFVHCQNLYCLVLHCIS